MKVFLTVTEAFKADFLEFCKQEAMFGFYAFTPKKMGLRDADFLPPAAVTAWAGATLLEGGAIYVSCAGNWICMIDGKVRVGGRRYGIPFARRTDVLSWEYPVGGTLTPHIGPFDHPDEKDLSKLAEVARKHEVEIAITGLDAGKRQLIQKAARLNGYSLQRAKEFLCRTLQPAEYSGLFSS